MVIKLTGNIDGNEVIFVRREGEWWETTVPATLTGMYIVSMTAWDEAGNVSFVTKFMLTFDPDDMVVKLEPYPWDSELLSSEWKSKCYSSDYIAEITGSDWICELLDCEVICCECNSIGWRDQTY